MANKDLFKQAIAEAKSVREAAIANAKEALEETLTPHLKDMLAAKLQEMEDSQNEEVVNESEEVEETAEETVNEEVNEEETVEEATEEIEEAAACPKCGKTHEGSCGTHEEVSEEGLTEIEPVEAADEDEAEDDSEESEDEAEHDEMPDGDEDISNLSVDQFKDMIRDIISQEVGGDAAADDMDAGDIEGMGDEDGMEAGMEEPEMAGDEEEIDLDELLAELEATEEVTEGEDKDDKKMEEEAVEEVSTAKSTEVQDTANAEAQGTNVNRVVKEDATEDKTELEQALDTIETLKSELNEVNILNSKLLYVNKIFKSNNLSESQKVNIIAAFDKAETVKEVKLVFETVSDNIIDVKKENVSEAKVKGMASKATGTTASKPQGEIVLSEAAQRMQKLAGIIK
jgi:hypothetical protein